MLQLYLLVFVPNLCLATIPRCDLIMSAMQKIMTPQVEEHCAHHKVKPMQGRVIKDDKMCKCALARFMFARLTEIRIEPVLTRGDQAIFTIEFKYDFSPKDYLSPIETPPPRLS